MVLKPGVRGLYGRPCDKFNLTVVSDLYYLLASRWKIFLHITKLAVCLHTAKQLNNTVPSSRCVVVVSASWWIMNAVVFRGDHCLVEKCVCVFIFFIFFLFYVRFFLQKTWSLTRPPWRSDTKRWVDTSQSFLTPTTWPTRTFAPVTQKTWMKLPAQCSSSITDWPPVLTANSGPRLGSKIRTNLRPCSKIWPMSSWESMTFVPIPWVPASLQIFTKRDSYYGEL